MSRPYVLLNTPAVELIWWPYREWRWRTEVNLEGVWQHSFLWLEVRIYSRKFQGRYRRELARQKNMWKR